MKTQNIGDEVVDRKTLTDRSLDVEVAERVVGLVPCTSDQHNEGAQFYMPRPCHAMPDSPDKGGETLCYSSDIAAAMQVEDRVADLGLQNDYIAHLWDEVGAKREGSNFWTAQNFNAFWLCVHATPEQRCRAALKAVEHLSTNDGQAS